jgi:hypothetical protein
MRGDRLEIRPHDLERAFRTGDDGGELAGLHAFAVAGYRRGQKLAAERGDAVTYLL